MSKRDLVRRHKEEQEATAFAFQEFIKTFQDAPGPPNKLFVKAGILNAKNGREDESEKGKIYNPSAFIKPNNSNTLKNAIECARLLKENKVEKVKGSLEKPKSNLELLKEELRLRHLERNARNKASVKEDTYNSSTESSRCSTSIECNENFDTNTTNLFVANINPKLTEQDLMQLFGTYGPLASVKIMWPRNDEKNNSRSSSNCGFVAYMSRKDAERALKELKNKDDMRIGWGKPVELPVHPIYIPPEFVKLLLPPPYTGLPFNAQPFKQPFEYPKNDEAMQDLLYNSQIKVTIPLDKKMLMLIHHMIEYVVNEGPMFEAMIMNNELTNPTYQFLFDNKSALHVYYRWKLYSILQGESPINWSTKKFRMFIGGSIWVPPLVPNYTEGMPECLFGTLTKTDKKLLSDAQKNRLVQHIQQLKTSRKKVGEAMVFCLNHGEYSKDIVEIITSCFENSQTKPTKKIARLYLVSDILYNCGTKKFAPLRFRDEFQEELPKIFDHLQKTYNFFGRISDKESFKSRILKVLRAWDLWKIYPTDFLNKLENFFVENVDNLDNDSGIDEPLDGKSLLKRSLKNCMEGNSAPQDCIIVLNNEKPLREVVKVGNETVDMLQQGFIPSKWEVIDPEQVEAQAMSTKKLFDIEMERTQTKINVSSGNEEYRSGRVNEEREKLRQIEVLVMQYQDELENGKRKLKKGKNLEGHLSEYRAKLVAKMKKDLANKLFKNTSPISSDSSPESYRGNKKDQRESRSKSKKKSGRDRHQKRSFSKK